MGVVIDFRIPPRKDHLRYKRYDYTITFIPDTKQWEWSFLIQPGLRLTNTAKSYADAMQAARTHIDLAIGTQHR